MSRLCKWNGVLVGVLSLDGIPGLGLRQVYTLDFLAAIQRDLAISNADASSTQRLLRHLRQLDAAFAAIQEHACRTPAQTSPLPSAGSTGQTASGLVLMIMHAEHKYASIKRMMTARLEVACLTCMKKCRVRMPP